LLLVSFLCQICDSLLENDFKREPDRFQKGTIVCAARYELFFGGFVPFSSFLIAEAILTMLDDQTPFLCLAEDIQRDLIVTSLALE
jgi:hypothetical protein